ncbi:MAG: tyrosine-type recombinase/integrase [Myxococcota bacterium]
MLTWASRSGIRSTADLDRPQLAALRAWLIALPKQRAKTGGKRGQQAATRSRRSPVAVNRELRAIKTFLHELRRSDRLPHLDRDAVADTLRALPVPREQPFFLSPPQIKKLLKACLAHDQATFVLTRREREGLDPKGSTLRHRPIAPFAALLLLSGMRRGEALALRWRDVDLDATDVSGHPVGEIRLRAAATKTHQARTVGLEVSPRLRLLLQVMQRCAQGSTVFEGYSAQSVSSARARLVRDFGAPHFDWQGLRSTCGTYLTNAPSIFGAAAPFMSARQLGHSVVVAEKHYAGLLRGISPKARSLDAAMGIEDLLEALVQATRNDER